MRAQLIELTPESRARSRKAWWLNMPFTIAWQSSKVPSIASAWTLSSATVVIIRRCTSEMRPCGNSTKRSVRARPRNASIAAPPVSPEVATTMVVRSPRAVERMVHEPAEQLHRQILEGERRAVKQLEHEIARLRTAPAGPPPDGGNCRRPRAPCGRDRAREWRRRRTGGSPRPRLPHRAGRRSLRSHRRRAAARPPAHRGRRRGRAPRASPRQSRAAEPRPGWKHSARSDPPGPDWFNSITLAGVRYPPDRRRKLLNLLAFPTGRGSGSRRPGKHS